MFHNSFYSSINDYKYTSISFLGAHFPGMIMERVNDIQEGRLYNVSTTSQIL